MSQLEEKTFTSDGITINYAEGSSEGAALVLLHGLGRNWQDFLALVPEFSKQWHVYAVDLRGHGKSGRAPQSYTSAGYATDIAALLRNVVEGSAVVFGHSLGGVVGMRLAAENQERVRALILGDSILSRNTLPTSLYADLFAGLHEVALQGGAVQEMASRLAQIRITVPHFDEKIALGEFPGNDDAFFRRWADCLRQVDPEVFAMTLNGSGLADFDGDDLLSKIDCPTLILQASPDLGGLMSDEEISRATRILKKASVVRFPLLGHSLHLQNPRPVLECVMKFLSSL